jgi:hypothetical protein
MTEDQESVGSTVFIRDDGSTLTVTRDADENYSVVYEHL